MATKNQVGNSLTGSTGTGAFVGANTPTLITPELGVATADSIAFNDYTTGCVIGTATNNNAATGSVGEYVTSAVAAGSAVALTTATSANVTSISLTAGDWDVWGNVAITASGPNMGGGNGWISLVSATFPDTSLVSSLSITAGGVAVWRASVPYVRLSLSGTTTVYLSAQTTFAVGTAGASGGIHARRAR